MKFVGSHAINERREPTATLVADEPVEVQGFRESKGRFRLWPNFERRSVWTNENVEMSKVRPLGLHTRGRSPKAVASKRA
jgi:hypothetical protein